MSNIGIFGGTFNPIHNGHVRLLESVCRAVEFEKVIVLPDRIPPHKQACELADSDDRLNMCRLAFEKVKNVQVSDWELKRQGKSYSVLTLRHFHGIYPDKKLYFILGSDMLLTFKQWYCWEEILKLASIICISRQQSDTYQQLDKCAEELSECGGEIIVLDEKPFEVSSTQIRAMIKKNMDCTCYLNKNVVQYITERNLYNRGFIGD